MFTPLTDQTAHVLSIGAGELSRIYQTTDAGATWTQTFRNDDPKGFLDAISFWKSSSGLAQGDPIDGRFLIVATDDGGKSWSRVTASVHAAGPAGRRSVRGERNVPGGPGRS